LHPPGLQRYYPAVAKEARRLQRQLNRADGAADGKSKKKALARPVVAKPGESPDPLGKEQLRSLGLRLGIPIAGAWLVGLFIFGVSHGSVAKSLALGLPAAVTLAAGGLVFWVVRQAKKARGVASILSEVETAEDRKAALSKLDASFKKNDPAAVFAKAQLELQEDPKKALATLEKIDLNKVMAPIADEARAQRAMIHLMLGEVSQARQLVDNVDLSRHQEARTRAMLAAVVAEAWARSGQAKKAQETLELFDPEDSAYEQIRPQLYRALAYAYAYTNDIKGMRRVLKKLLDQDVRLLGSFMLKKTHPLLQKEVKKMLEQSGQMPRKMVVQRRM
jgi:hypothetical protein